MSLSDIREDGSATPAAAVAKDTASNFEPVFVLASPRSFTSPVCAMLGQHPGAYGVPEVSLLAFETLSELVDHSSGQRQFLLHGMLRCVAQLYAGEQTVESIAMAHRWMNRRAQSSTAEVYCELFRKVSPLRIVDKSPVYSKNSDALERLEAAFPNASYIYLVRNPVDQGRSMMNAPQAVAELIAAESIDFSTNPPTIDPQIEWYDTQARIMKFLEGVPQERQHFLRGEELIADPRGHLAHLCEWLGLPWDDEICEAMLKTEESPYACMGPYGAQWGNNPGFQKSPTFRSGTIETSSLHGSVPWRKDGRALSPAVVELAHALGYE